MTVNIMEIDTQQEKNRIVTFLKEVFAKQQIENAVIGLSGGIDSTVSFYLLKEVLSPEHIFAAHLYYDSPTFPLFKNILDSYKIPATNRSLLSIKPSVYETAKLLGAENDNVRTGNIAARMRMITLFDLAKKHTALVCGTENKTENLLGYFTRFGDQASDIEPIEHLYKTQVYQLAKHLDIPEGIITQEPTAGLWVGQTDEGEFGFTYEEADQVLYLNFEKKISVEELERKGLFNAKKILDWHKRNLFKHNTPYVIT
jgi:NAD+ synthase